MTSTTHEIEDEQQLFGPGWKGLALLGLLMVVGGFVAFLNPFAASLTVEFVAGAAFLIVGALQLWLAFTGRAGTSGDRWLSGALGLALVVLAISLIANPLAGLVTLTILVAMLFALMGGLRIALALNERPREGWGWLLASGAVSLALAVLIVLGLPAAAAGILGILLGIDLTMSGAATLGLAWNAWRHRHG
ncbi:HdeD family acid-resistance protein [Roseovarius sp. TE539]|uniref:HdeD family acid-resistance protein n=1 Tax=Roseovarius sp. TE539 TaxID=2249812 RepID=UPI000DDCE56F|nr:DUF308 domain-containing protein [Roseovarius sp. TE539]RBI77444.1 HdeD family acid-resistance protein [Roseovarius sp. TE539]